MTAVPISITKDNPYYLLEQEYTPIPGTTVRAVLEFPEIGKDGKSLIYCLDDIMTVSYSVYRTKIRMIPLGGSTIRGYGLGTRLVAGSIIRSVFTTDKISKMQEDIYYANQKEIKERLDAINGKIPLGLEKQDITSVMKDDLTSFNLHLVTKTESIIESTDSNGKSTYSPHSRYEVILGCLIINTGQVFSIEDLVTESTFSFEAKSVKIITDLNKSGYSAGYSNNKNIITGSSLL